MRIVVAIGGCFSPSYGLGTVYCGFNAFGGRYNLAAGMLMRVHAIDGLRLCLRSLKILKSVRRKNMNLYKDVREISTC